MDGIDGNKPIGALDQSDPSARGERVSQKSSEQLSEQEIMEAWEPAGMMVIQGAIFYLFPEARRIQERAQAYNKEVLGE